jgi:hypothetical protein
VPVKELIGNSNVKSLKAPGSGEKMIKTEFNITVRTNCIFMDLSFLIRNSHFKDYKFFKNTDTNHPYFTGNIHSHNI